jgi:hypothetical protein
VTNSTNLQILDVDFIFQFCYDVRYITNSDLFHSWRNPLPFQLNNYGITCIEAADKSSAVLFIGNVSFLQIFRGFGIQRVGHSKKEVGLD